MWFLVSATANNCRVSKEQFKIWACPIFLNCQKSFEISEYIISAIFNPFCFLHKQILGHLYLASVCLSHIWAIPVCAMNPAAHPHPNYMGVPLPGINTCFLYFCVSFCVYVTSVNRPLLCLHVYNVIDIGVQLHVVLCTGLCSDRKELWVFKNKSSNTLLFIGTWAKKCPKFKSKLST